MTEMLYSFAVISLIYTIAAPFVFLKIKNFNDGLRDPELFKQYVLITKVHDIDKHRYLRTSILNYFCCLLISIILYVILVTVSLLFIDINYVTVLITSVIFSLLFIVQFVILLLFFKKFIYTNYRRSKEKDLDLKTLTNPFLISNDLDFEIVIKKTNGDKSLRSYILNKNINKLQKRLKISKSDKNKYLVMIEFLCGCSQMIHFMERGSEWDSLNLYVNDKLVDSGDFKKIIIKKLSYIYQHSFNN